MGKFNFNAIQNATTENGFSMGTIFRGVLLAYVITLIIFLIFSVIITYSNFPESAMQAVVIVTTLFSILVAASKVARKAKNRGWFNGALTGLFYMIILYFISCMSLTGFKFDIMVIYMLILGLLAGSVGGIAGINLKRGR